MLREKFYGEMGLKKQKQLIPGAVPTVQSPGANNYSEVRERPLQNEDTEKPEVADSADKRPRRSRAAEKLEISRVSRKTLQLLYRMIYRKYM